MEKPAPKKTAKLAPADDYIVPDLRYQVDSWILGRLERLAKSNAELEKLVEEDF